MFSADRTATSALAATSATTVESHLMCPVDHVPLRQAVIVLPCTHRVQEAVAERVFGQRTGDDWKIPSGLQCPVCQRTADNYLVDTTIRSIANIVFPIYPGVKATFAHIKGDWEVFGPEQHLCRKMDFATTTPGAFIKKFELLGFIQGKVKLWIEFDPAYAEQFQKHLKSQGINIELSSNQKREGKYRTDGKKELRDLFAVVVANNIFPEEQLAKMKSIVAVGKIPPMMPSRGSSADPLLEMLMGEGLPGMGRLGGGINLLQMMQHLQQATSADEVQEPIAYPGQSATFALKEGDWEPFGPLKDLCRKMDFISSTPGSLINSFSILGYIQGDVRIVMHFDQSNVENIRKYFAGKGVKLIFSPQERRMGFFKTGDVEELKAVFKEIAANNTIQAEHLAKLQAIVDAGKIPATAAPRRESSEDGSREPDCKVQ